MLEKLSRKELIEELKEDNTIVLLEEVGEINLDDIEDNIDLEMLIDVLEVEFGIETRIQSLIGGHYLVNENFEPFEDIHYTFGGWDI